MKQTLGRDLDLNLLRVFIVVAQTGSVTAAAARLYLTQPAVSAALKRLAAAVGAPLFSRAGRGLALTARGERLLADAGPHLTALVEAALAPSVFDPKTAERTLRLGLSDTTETWLLPSLVRTLEKQAPRMRVVVIPVQFRTVGPALASGSIDLAVTVADDMPAGILRKPLFTGGFVCLFDPRHAKLPPKLTRKVYLAHEHVIVSYNGDLRGVVEDLFGVRRSVRVSLPSFTSIGPVIEGTKMLATVPELVARDVMKSRPKLKTTALPFELASAPLEMLWRGSRLDDQALAFVMAHIERIAATLQG